MTDNDTRRDNAALLVQLALLSTEARRIADQHTQQDVQRAAYYYGVAFAYEDAAECVKALFFDG